MRISLILLAVLFACSGEDETASAEGAKADKAASRPATVPSSSSKKSADPSWIGLKHQDLEAAQAKALGLAKPDGAFVLNVANDGPADKAGLEADDVVVSFDGRPIRRSIDLINAVKATPPGKKVTVVVMRDGKRTERKLVTEKRPS